MTTTTESLIERARLTDQEIIDSGGVKPSPWPYRDRLEAQLAKALWVLVDHLDEGIETCNCGTDLEIELLAAGLKRPK